MQERLIAFRAAGSRNRCRVPGQSPLVRRLPTCCRRHRSLCCCAAGGRAGLMEFLPYQQTDLQSGPVEVDFSADFTRFVSVSTVSKLASLVPCEATVTVGRPPGPQLSRCKANRECARQTIPDPNASLASFMILPTAPSAQADVLATDTSSPTGISIVVVPLLQCVLEALRLERLHHTHWHILCAARTATPNR